MMRLLMVLALALPVAAQTLTGTLTGPPSVMVGDPVFLRLADGATPLPGVTLRITGPGLETGTVTASALNLRESPGGTIRGELYRTDRVLIKGETGDGWCEVTVAHGGGGFVSCEYLDREPYGQPVGVTDVDGRVVTLTLAVVPGTLTITGGGATFTLQVRPLVKDDTSVLAPGIVYRSRRWVAAADGPFTMHILEVDRHEPNVFVLPVRARDRAVGKATTSSMAQRYGAIAAVNGGPFAGDGLSLGLYQLDEQTIAGNLAVRGALVRCHDGSLESFEAAFRGSVTAGGTTMSLTGVNRVRSAQDLLLFRPIFGSRTGTGPDGVEVVLDSSGNVRALYEGQGNAQIPADGQVLSGAGQGADFLRRSVASGFSIRFAPVITPGCSAVDVVGAGPRLVWEGRANIGGDGFGNERVRSPRTAFALTARGTWLLVTVDGRQPSSQGMRLDELAAELVSLGAVRAVNLDGGSSTTMVVDDTVRNSPSGGREPEVSDGVLVFSVHNLASLRQVMDRVALDPGQVAPEAIEPLYQRYDNALAAFADEELDRVRLEIEALRAEIKQRSGGELTPAAARVLGEAASAYLRLLPQIQQGLSRRKPVR